MAIRDVTDRAAVEAALAEHDRIGRGAFLAKYGFGQARGYFLVHDGKRYDSKAIVGAAHEYQHGARLAAADFSGGSSTVLPALSRLGFNVETVGPRDAWDLSVGSILMRDEISRRFGGSPYGGIEPSAKTPNVFIFTDPTTSHLYGYNFDHWDSSEPGTFYYTGEGKLGDQKMKEGNKAILEHRQKSRKIRLFESMEPTRGSASAAKPQRYLGELELDEQDPYRIETAPDTKQKMRDVFVFKLHRVDAERPTESAIPVRPLTGPPSQGGVDGEADAREVTSAVPQQSQLAGGVQLVRSERNTALEFETAPRTGGVARRIEAGLVTSFEEHLTDLGHETGRYRIPIPGEHGVLITDCCDITQGVVYEAKAGADRATVRLAIGQLHDYLRWLPGLAGALLLPNRPSQDVCNLIQSVGYGLTYRDGSSWRTVAKP